MEEKVNIFNGGINSDISQTFTQENTYVHALNCDITIDEGLSSISLTNAKGNKFQVSIPETYNLHSFSTKSGGGLTRILIKGISFPWSPNTLEATNYNLYQSLIKHFDIYIKSGLISIHYNDSNVVIMELDQSATVKFSRGVGVLDSITRNTERDVPAQKVQHPIGYGVINKDIYIITTSSTNKEPKKNGGGYGFIWKFNYDGELFDTASIKLTLDLIYAANLNMSTYHNIPPTAVVARYETDIVQKLWFTDFYGPLRYVNVVDPQLMATDPSLLSFTPKFNMYKPVLREMKDGGATPMFSGTYQAAYRLRKSLGSETVFSPLSNMVNVVDKSMSEPYVEYYSGSRGGNTNKILTWNVTNIDIDFDFIDFIIIKRVDGGNLDLFTILIVAEEDINNRESIDFDISGDQIEGPDAIEITLNELVDTAAGAWFTHCKTITEKDNLLIAANLKNDGISELDFDARAFRAKHETTTSWPNNDQFAAPVEIVVTNNGNKITYPTLQKAVDSDDQLDNVNDNNGYTQKLDATSDFCSYIPGTGVLGGKGLNVEYYFITLAHLADTTANRAGTLATQARNNWTILGREVFAPYFKSGKQSDSTKNNVNLDVTNGRKDIVAGFYDDEIYEKSIGQSGGFYDDNKNPHTSGASRGYRRGETYRFGIQFYTKDQKPYFVKWIGDIKFPTAHESSIGPDGTYQNFYSDGDTKFPGGKDFRVCLNNGTSTYLHNLGIRFNISGLDKLSNIGGYSIVRCERKKQDKTILDQGYTTATNWDAKSNSRYSELTMIDTQRANAGFLRFPVNNYKDINQYKLRYVSNYGENVSSEAKKDRKTGEGTELIRSSKFTRLGGYHWETKRLDVFDSLFHPGGGTILKDAQGLDVQCRTSPEKYYPVGQTFNFWNPPPERPSNEGNQAIYYDVNYYPGQNSNIDGALAIANIEVENLKQYGGSNYNARSKSKYISCGHFRPILQNTKADSWEPMKIMGGDTFLCLYDSIPFYYDPFANTQPAINKSTYIYIVPLESDVNIELMGGFRANGNIDDSPTEDFYFSRRFNAGVWRESNHYYNVYSAEDNLREFIPSPNPFYETDKWINRFAASNVKINGELNDSWTEFPISDIWEANGIYGEINGLINRGNHVFFLQDNAMGIIQINPNVVIADTANPNLESQVQMGFGQKLHRHDYVTELSGTRHQGSIINAWTGLFWVDSDKKKIMKYSSSKDGTSATPIDGLYAYLNDNFNAEEEDKPSYTEFTNATGGGIGISIPVLRTGVIASYDEKRGKIYFTIHNLTTANSVLSFKSFTVCYNEKTGKFTSFFSFKPNMYISDGRNLMSFNDQDLYIHEEGDFGVFYGKKEKSTLTFIVNEGPTITKRFDTMNLNTDSVDIFTAPGVQRNINDDTWKRVRFTNDHQNTDFQSLVYNPSMSNRGNIVRSERTWKLAIPRNRVLYTNDNSPNIYTDLSPTNIKFAPRMRDKYIKVELEYDNDDNNMLRTNAITTTFTPSPS